jgi:hypothetical protein
MAVAMVTAMAMAMAIMKKKKMMQGRILFSTGYIIFLEENN